MLVFVLVVIASFLVINYGSIKKNVTYNRERGLQDYIKNNDKWKSEPNRIMIPALGVFGKTLYPKTLSEVNKNLNDGILHLPDTSIPGETGNIVYTAHSSALNSSYYSNIFATLNKLKVDDKIYLYKDGQEYKYSVKVQKVITPTKTELEKLPKDNSLILLTCWPLGTDWKRLAIIATPEK